MSKGREKPSLVTISRELIHTSESNLLFKELTVGSDRACAIVGAAIVDQVLVFQLHGAMRELTRTEFLELFFASRAILQTMAARIDIAYALQLNDRKETNQLHSVRRIRNAFAHAARPISFEHDLVKKECAKLSHNYIADDASLAGLAESRRRYTGICIGTFGHFHKRQDIPHYNTTVEYLKSLDSAPPA